MAANESSGGAAGRGRPQTSVLLAFIVSIFLAGANAVAVRFTVAELAPFWGAALRFAAAAAIFAAIVLLRRIPLPHGRTLTGVILYGILNFGLSFALVYIAISEVTAGFTMIILALTPLLTFILAVGHRLEPFRWRALFGALLALVGIAVAFAGQAGSAYTSPGITYNPASSNWAVKGSTLSTRPFSVANSNTSMVPVRSRPRRQANC